MKKYPALFVIIALFFCINIAFSQWVFPGEEWEYHECKSIDGISDFIVDSMNTTGLVIIQEGKIVFTYGDI